MRCGPSSRAFVSRPLTTLHSMHAHIAVVSQLCRILLHYLVSIHSLVFSYLLVALLSGGYWCSPVDCSPASAWCKVCLHTSSHMRFERQRLRWVLSQVSACCLVPLCLCFWLTPVSFSASTPPKSGASFVLGAPVAQVSLSSTHLHVPWSRTN